MNLITQPQNLLLKILIKIKESEKTNPQVEDFIIPISVTDRQVDKKNTKFNLLVFTLEQGLSTGMPQTFQGFFKK